MDSDGELSSHDHDADHEHQSIDSSSSKTDDCASHGTHNDSLPHNNKHMEKNQPKPQYTFDSIPSSPADDTIGKSKDVDLRLSPRSESQGKN